MTHLSEIRSSSCLLGHTARKALYCAAEADAVTAGPVPVRPLSDVLSGRRTLPPPPVKARERTKP